MRNRHGDFIWYELMTTDMDAARAFYEPVVGWTIGASSGQPGMDYRMIGAADGMVGGMMGIDADMAAHGARPLWIGYVGVDDVDATATAIREKGGHVFMGPRDIPGVGRLAMAGDPQGGSFYVMRGFPDETSTAFKPGAIGHAAWHELATPDQSAAHDFYFGLFGWTSPEKMPMGEMGDYCFLYSGETRFGATMQRPGAALWQPYFTVRSIAASIEAVKAGGGAITNGPHPVPGGDTIIIGTDPQGARFALVGGA